MNRIFKLATFFNMNISFRKKNGDDSLGIEFFWMLAIETETARDISDYFIPELFFDFFFVKSGKMTCIDRAREMEFSSPAQALKTIYTRPLSLIFSAPLVLFGARLSLGFAESFWRTDGNPNLFLAENWVEPDTNNIDSFAAQVKEYIQKHQARKLPYRLLLPTLEESGWLVNFSARHKRRLYQTTFGLSRKEIQNIHNIQLFLAQACDFSLQNPRIIRHVNPDVFYDQPHLNRTFKKITGLSPVEYFEANSILQSNLMSASYNDISDV